ncbi:hypothetical protein ACIBCM_29985 [Streptomyces sp. NPDC051018]|uniref:hypothetical protein n=1 Tax=Streptomyces sp. NPDC051018 TaxID=3365639 RepID=UPI00379308D1
MWSTLIAVLGTLAGVALASATQLLTARRDRDRQHHQDVVDAADALLAAVLSYRELYWLRTDSIRAGEPDPTDRAAVYAARSAVTRARDRLALVTDEAALVDASQDAAWSAIDLSEIHLGSPVDGRFAPEVEAQLDAGREISRDAHTDLREAVTAYVHRRR